ncbi:PREDICTED: uncharacterized protein LOC105316949 [Amphimedon queenslandica]|nr:PREDICTED: uncharacterized protein LOC105316949 [Amphimedon queenslandica]|eukprot:XP_011410576.1 PREDICTED: uncharacterized protein LOC105316949 [Amphimedon queenslandica]
MTQEEYECLVRLLTVSPSYYTYQPLYWSIRSAPYDWESIMKARGQQLVIPFVFQWLGLLKIGLIKEGLSTIDDFYKRIIDAFVVLKDNNPKMTDTKGVKFIVLTNARTGNFQATYCMGLATVYSTISSKTNRIGVMSRSIPVSFLSRIETRWDAILKSIESDQKGFAGSFQPSLLSVKPFDFKKKDISSMLEKALEQEQEERIEYLEGTSSLGFQLELEKSFVYIIHQLQENGTDYDDYSLKYSLYESESSSIELNKDFLQSIGESIEEFIDSQCHEFLFEEKN